MTPMGIIGKQAVRLLLYSPILPGMAVIMKRFMKGYKCMRWRQGLLFPITGRGMILLQNIKRR